MEQHKQIQMYIGFEEGGCQDIATIKLEGFSLVANNELEALKAERDALVAQVEILKNAGNEVYDELQQWALTESHKETDKAFRLWLKARKQSPQQHLAEIRADASVSGYYQGFKDGLVIECPRPDGTNTASPINYQQVAIENAARMRTSQYAAKVRQGGQ
jgi:hypothetical protein